MMFLGLPGHTPVWQNVPVMGTSCYGRIARCHSRLPPRISFPRLQRHSPIDGKQLARLYVQASQSDKVESNSESDEDLLSDDPEPQEDQAPRSIPMEEDSSFKARYRQLRARTKDYLITRLAECGANTEGNKVTLASKLTKVEFGAREAKIGELEFVAQGGLDEFEVKKDEDMRPESDLPDMENTPSLMTLNKMTVVDIKRQLAAFKLSVRGNKPILLARLKEYYNEREGPKTESGTDTEDPETSELSGEEDSQLSPEDIRANEERDKIKQLRFQKDAELQLLTVSEIRNLLKARRLSIGMGKRKSELVQKLLDYVYPLTNTGQPIFPTKSLDKPKDMISRRKDLINRVRELLPQWSPIREDNDFKHWPFLEIQKALGDRELSMSGSREELLQRLALHEANILERLEAVSLEDIHDLLEAMDEPHTSNEPPRIRLFRALASFPWFDPPVTKYDDLDLMEDRPMIDNRLEDPKVDVLLFLNPTSTLSSNLTVRALQSIIQSIDTSSHQGGGITSIRGVTAHVLIALNDDLWTINKKDLHISFSDELVWALQNSGRKVGKIEDLPKLIHGSNLAILPILIEENRNVLEALEKAKIDYIGSPYQAGQNAIHKAKLNSVLKQLKYPVVPQLYLDQKVLEEAFGKEENDALNQRSPEEKNTQVDRDSKDDESLEADTEESEEMSESRYKLMSQIEAWARENDIFKELQAYIIKPALGSYSENVISVLSLEEALEVLEALFSQGIDEIVVEPHLRNIMEFSVTVVDTPSGPQAFMPLEIEIEDPQTDFIDAELSMQKYFATIKGYTDEDALAENLQSMKEEALLTNPDILMYDLAKKLLPDPRVKIRSPPRLDTEITKGIRNAAVKAFQDLGLRDYARIDGVVQLPPKPKPKDEKPEEIENYHVPTVDELASQLRPSDNSTMIPPWDPPEVEEINPEEARVWTEQIYQDPFFQDMGPYSNPELASQYHSDEVELEDDGVDETGKPKAKIVTKLPQFTQEELDEILDEETPWKPENYDPQAESEDMLHLSDKVEWTKPRKDLIGKSWQEKGEIIAKENHVEDPMESFVVDIETASPQSLSRFENGTILITDVNVSPPLDQDSLVLKSAAQIGITPNAFFRHLISNFRFRNAKPLLPWRGVSSIKETTLKKHEFPDAELQWENYPPTTERERALPWYHERFRYKGLDDNLEEAVEKGWSADMPDDSDEDWNSSGSKNGSDSDFTGLRGPLANQLAGGSEEDQKAPANGSEYMHNVGRSSFAYNVPSSSLSSWEQDRGPGEPSTSGRNEEHDKPYHYKEYKGIKQKVWILCGGVGSQADQSLASGMNVANILRNEPDLIVELFLVSPPCGGTGEKERRKQLLWEHVERVKISSDRDINQPSALEIRNIRNSPLAEVDVTNRETWCLPCHLLLSNTASGVQEACEWTVQDNSTIERLAEPWQKDAESLRHLIRDQLIQCGVVDAGSGWGLEGEVVAPVCIDMYELMIRANCLDAVVYNLVQGDIGEDGTWHAFCDRIGAVFVGSEEAITQTCIDKMRLSAVLLEMESDVIDTPPRSPLTKDLLIGHLLSEQGSDEFENLFRKLYNELGVRNENSLCIRPANEHGNIGAAKIDSPEDLAVYAEALHGRIEEIPSQTLSWGNPSIPMPPQPPSNFVVEPYSEPDNLVLSCEGESTDLKVSWNTPYRIAEFEISLVGVRGRMKALTPAIFAYSPAQYNEYASVKQESEETLDSETEEEDEEDELEVSEDSIEWQTIKQLGARIPICPPPSHILSTEMTNDLLRKSEEVAKFLGLSGIVSLQGTIHTDTGVLNISDIVTVPSLHSGALIFKQAAAENPPINPSELLKRAVYQSLIEYDKNGNPIEIQINEEEREPEKPRQRFAYA